MPVVVFVFVCAHLRVRQVNVANAVNVKQTLAAAASAVVVVIINYHSLRADRGKVRTG